MGRPKGSKNKPKVDAQPIETEQAPVAVIEELPVKKKGRPKGSKNKPKVVQAIAVEPAPLEETSVIKMEVQKDIIPPENPIADKHSLLRAMDNLFFRMSDDLKFKYYRAAFEAGERCELFLLKKILLQIGFTQLEIDKIKSEITQYKPKHLKY